MRTEAIAIVVALVACGRKDVRDAPPDAGFEHALASCDGDVAGAARDVETRARAGTKLDASVTGALFSCFEKRAPSKDDGKTNEALRAALLATAPAQNRAAAAMLARPVNPADSFDARGVHKTNDELARQTVALEVLAAAPDQAAARPLVTVLMTRDKRTLWPLARVALAKTPSASERVLAAALDGSDAGLAALRAPWARDDGYVPNLADALADVGLDSARDALLAAAPSLANDANRGAVAETLVWLAPSARVVATFRALYDRLPPIAGEGGIERAALLQAAADLLDASLFDWVLAEFQRASGEQMVAARAGAVQSAIKLMQPGQEARVAAAIATLEDRSGLSALERHEIAGNVHPLYDRAAESLAKCKTDVACHLALLDEPIPPESHANWKAIKSATMCGLLGDGATREALVAKIARVRNPGVRLAMARAILRLATTDGDAKDATALEAVANAESLGPDDPIARVARILRARAAP